MSQSSSMPSMPNKPCEKNPYPGLRPYEENEQEQFFGRDADTQILLDKILTHRLTLLFAATGVGKSSLLKAAVMPRLKAASGKHLDVVYYNDWVSTPLAGLKAEIARTVLQSANWPPGTQLDKNLELAEFVQFCTLFVRPPLVIMLDQFEELFRYRKQYHAKSFQPFIDELTGLITATRIPVSVVFSMREDFALELNAFKPKLPTLLFENYYRLERLPAEAAKDAIVNPLRPLHFQYEPELLQQLLQDLLKYDPDRDLSSLGTDDELESVIPPQLQIVCSQLWQKECGNQDRILHLAVYEEAGRAQGLLKNYVEKALKAFTESDRRILSRAFDHLVSIQGAKMPHTVATLAEKTGDKATDLQRVLEKLASQEVRILRSQQREKQTWYEIYHDMYSGSINAWNRRQKRKMLRRKLAILGGAALLVGLLGYFGTVAYVHSISHHLRLTPGNDNQVEVFKGKQGWPDPFGQQQFESETFLLSREIEADKGFQQKGLLDYADVNSDLIGYQPLEERISAYIQDGNFARAEELFDKTVKGNSGKQASDVLRRLFSLKTERSFQKIKHLAASEKDASINKMALDLFAENTTALPLESLDGLRIYHQSLKAEQTNAINLDYAKNSPLIFYKLLAYLDSDNTTIRAQAASVLGQIGDRLAVVPLVDMLEDDHEEVRGNVASALGRIGDQLAVEPLLETLGDDNVYVRLSAANALGRISDWQAIEPLMKAMKDDNAHVRGNAASALGRISGRLAVELLVKALGDDHKYVRRAAAVALGQIGDKLAVEPLIKALGDDNEDVRRFAADALGRIGDRLAVELLVKMLGDAHKKVRRSTADALERIDYLNVVKYEKPEAEEKAIRPKDKYILMDFFTFNGRLDKVFGSAENRRQLLAALNLANSAERDQALLQLAGNTEIHLSIREKAINVLGEEGKDKAHIASMLQDLNPSQGVLKEAVKLALQQLSKDLQTKEVQTKAEHKVVTKKAVTQLWDQLKKLEQQAAEWRKFRDSKTADDFTGENKDEQRDKFLQQVRDKKAQISPAAAFDTAYALAMADPDSGIKLLNHPLLRARQGAYIAMMMKANIKMLQKLDKLREQRRDDPIFRHAAYRAIDMGLHRLQMLGNKDNGDQELRELEAWQKELESDQARRKAHLNAKDTYRDGEPVDEVLERLQWTTMMMKHTNKMTAKFAKDGWVRDWPENALPVNQPYPELKE